MSGVTRLFVRLRKRERTIIFCGNRANSWNELVIFRLYIFGMLDYFMQYESIINSACAKTEIPLDLYTPMKLMDMCFWQIGFDMDKKRDGE